MIRIWRISVPAFAATAVLLTAVLVDVRMTMTGRSGYHIDTIFNAIFIGIAILGFFLVGLPTKMQNERRLAGLLSNLLVSMLAFPMNIAVFGHKVNWTSPLEDLWGGHIGWLCSAVLQILLLSGLGEQLLSWVQGLLTLGAQAVILTRKVMLNEKIVVYLREKAKIEHGKVNRQNPGTRIKKGVGLASCFFLYFDFRTRYYTPRRYTSLYSG